MELLPYAIAIPVLALLIDLLFGEPPNRFHPVVWIGSTINHLDRRVRRGNAAMEKAMGVLVVLLPILLFIMVFTLFLAVLRDVLGAVAWALASAIMFKTMFAIRSLESHTAPMVDDLRRGDLDAARRKASMVVSRDVEQLDRGHIISCAAETVSENLVDSVLSPMFYFGLAGIPGAVLLRVTNTADGMIGYLSDKHRNVGWFAARLDDVLHYLVARMSVPFILLSLVLLKKDWRRGLSSAIRDHGQTSSPNKGWPMATVAGGLGVKFEKEGHYSMGEGEVPDDPMVIREAINVMKLTSVLFFAVVLLPLFIVVGIHVQLSLENWLLGLI